MTERVLEARDLLSKAGRAAVLGAAGMLLAEQQRYEYADELLGESLSLFREAGDTKGAALGLNRLGWSAAARGDHDSAIARWEESLELRRQLGDRWGIAQSLMNLGDSYTAKGDYGKADALFEESTALFEELGDNIGLSLTLGAMAYSTLRRKRYDRAEALAVQSLRLGQRLGTKADALPLDVIACAWTGQGKTVQALRLLAAVDALSESDPELATGLAGSRAEHEFCMSALRVQLDTHTFAKLRAEGRAMSPGEAIAYALKPTSGQLPDASLSQIPAFEGYASTTMTVGQPAYPDDLTEREVEVLRLIAAGKSNQEIAQQLVLSLRTVERHISNIYGKIGATGKVARAFATAYSLHHGLTG